MIFFTRYFSQKNLSYIYLVQIVKKRFKNLVMSKFFDNGEVICSYTSGFKWFHNGKLGEALWEAKVLRDGKQKCHGMQIS